MKDILPQSTFSHNSIINRWKNIYSLFRNFLKKNITTTKAIFFRQQEKKSLGLLHKKSNKQFFSRNAINHKKSNSKKSIYLLFFLSVSISFFSLTCQPSKKISYHPNASFRLTIYVGEKNVKICLHSISVINPTPTKTCSDVYENEVPCTTHPTEKPLFSMSPKEAADIVFKGISEIQLKNPKIGRKIEKLVIFSLDSTEAKTKEAQTKFEKDLEAILKSSKIDSMVKRLDAESTSKILYESAIQDFPIQDNSFYYLYTGENILHLHKFMNKSIQMQLHDDLGYDYLFEMGEKYRKEFFSCRQIISPSLGTFHSGWENFEDCKKFVTNRMMESKSKLFFEKITPDDSLKLYVIGGIWTDIRSFFSKDILTREEIKNSIRNTCKISTIELLNQKYNKNLSYKLCYDLSYADSILQLLKVNSLVVLPESNLSSSGALFSAFFPECIVQNQPSPKKK